MKPYEEKRLAMLHREDMVFMNDVTLREYFALCRKKRTEMKKQKKTKES